MFYIYNKTMAGGKIYLSAPRTSAPKRASVTITPARKSYRRRKRGARPRSDAVSISRGLLKGIPNRMFAKLPYASHVDQTSTTSLIVRQYRANSLYDPDFTGTGAQPMYRDQLVQLYNDYRVHAVKIDVTFTSVTTTNSMFYIGYQGDLTSTPTTLIQVRENPHFKTIIGNEQRPIRLSWYLPIHKIFGKSKTAIQADPNIGAGTGANPSKQGGLFAGFMNVDSTTSTTVDMYVRIIYFCEFNNPVLMTES